MPLATVVNYDPTLKTVTVSGDIASSSLTSIINQTRGRDLFVVGQTPITNRTFSDGNTTFTLDANTTGDNASDILSVRYQSSTIQTLTNGAIINGVANFWQNTPPSARIDGSALVDGDIWYKPDTQETWARKGIYWVSSDLYSNTTYAQGAYSNTTILTPQIGVAINQKYRQLIYIESINGFIRSVGAATANYNSSNYWYLMAYLLPTYSIGGERAISGLILFNNSNADTWVGFDSQIKTFYSISSQILGFNGHIYKVGSPGTIGGITFSINFRMVYS